MIDQRAVKEYLSLIGEKELSLNWFEVVEIEDKFPIERIRKLLNKRIVINKKKEFMQYLLIIIVGIFKPVL